MKMCTFFVCENHKCDEKQRPTNGKRSLFCLGQTATKYLNNECETHAANERMLTKEKHRPYFMICISALANYMLRLTAQKRESHFPK